METNKRVYPAQKDGGGMLSYLLLFLSAVLLLSGLVWREDAGKLQIHAAATPSPISLDEAFDETLVEQELTLPDATWYALQLGAFENEEAANQLAEQFSRRGAAGFVWPDDRFRVLAAGYPLREDAQSVRKQLTDSHMVDTYLYEIELPPLRLRIRGMKGQLEILQAAFVHAQDLAYQLYHLSAALDRQETIISENVEKLAALDEQLQIVSLRLQQRFTAPHHQTISALIQCFSDFSAFCRNAEQVQSEVSFGTLLKRQQLQTLYTLKQIYDTLSNT